MKYAVGLVAAMFLLVLSLLIFTFSIAQSPSTERLSPSDWILENQIHVFDDRVVLNLENAQWSRFTNTNSMDPLFDENANALEIKPQSPTSIQLGDIISYNYNGSIFIHRVVQMGQDQKGFYYIVQGDNASQPDSHQVRFEEIHGVVVAIIY